MTITGSGWPAGDDVTVFTNDAIGKTWSQTDQVAADNNGDFTDQVTLPNTFISNYTVEASDGSGLTATTTFTDAQTNLEGQSNPPCTTGASGCDSSVNGNWDTGAVSGWGEGNNVPVRVEFNSSGSNQAVTVPFDHTQTGSNSTIFGLDPVLPLLGDFVLGSLGPTYASGGQPTLDTSGGNRWAISFKVNVANGSPPTYVKFHLQSGHRSTPSSPGIRWASAGRAQAPAEWGTCR